ncbi:MAG: Nramp family divalent metal transporter [Candidatus Levybacteria bacterium]|nr:Nramp family divalent metal transporter [Candidatus Levybacteria bacterium]
MTFFKNRFRRLLPILAIIGPGIIAGNADNDAGGITTYSIAGAHYGYSLLWILLITTFALAVTQEIGARMGLATGKGLASLVREKFGLRWTAFIMTVFIVANIGVTAAEFAGIAAAMEIFNIPRFFSVPVAAFLVYLFITKGNFKTLERVFLILSSFYIVYILSAIFAKPDWGLAVKSLVIPSFSYNTSFILTAIAVIGTTITPWGQFFIQSYVVDKKLTVNDLKVERIDVFFGSFLTNFFSFFIIVACAATIFATGKSIVDAKDAALALQPLVGNLASSLFAFGLLNASIFGACILPTSTAYVVTEAFGFESGLDHSFKEAPQFYTIFTLFLIIGAIIVAFPFIPLIKILVLSQVLNAILLLPIFVFLYLLSNDKKLLNGHTNGKIVNIIVAIAFVLIAALSTIYMFSVFFH